MSKRYKISKTVLAIGSGKGGVGKSTVAVNLAVALASQGLSIGLLDADIYGPSIPIMLGLRRVSPRLYTAGDGRERIQPFNKFGFQSMSIGFFMEEAQSAMWRGPMLHTALEKMLADVEWSSLDLLLIDLPPGTGDIPISLSQLLQIDGAIIVCTPQEVAMVDAIKAINTFDQLAIPLVGIVENMAGFTVPGTTEIHHIFGEGKAKELAQRCGTAFLGHVPLNPMIRQGADEGYPVAMQASQRDASDSFHAIALELRKHCKNL